MRKKLETIFNQYVKNVLKKKTLLMNVRMVFGMDWIEFVKDHNGVRPVKSFKPVCSNSCFENKGSLTLYGWVE